MALADPGRWIVRHGDSYVIDLPAGYTGRGETPDLVSVSPPHPRYAQPRLWVPLVVIGAPVFEPGFSLRLAVWAGVGATVAFFRLPLFFGSPISPEPIFFPGAQIPAAHLRARIEWEALVPLGGQVVQPVTLTVAPFGSYTDTEIPT